LNRINEFELTAAPHRCDVPSLDTVWVATGPRVLE
jgi:hypothetical protein